MFSKAEGETALAGASAVAGVMLGTRIRAYVKSPLVEAGAGAAVVIGGCYISLPTTPRAIVIGAGAGILVDGILGYFGVKY